MYIDVYFYRCRSFFNDSQLPVFLLNSSSFYGEMKGPNYIINPLFFLNCAISMRYAYYFSNYPIRTEYLGLCFQNLGK